MKDSLDMYGGEADQVVVVGDGELESISRARISLAVLLCCPDEESRKLYNRYAAGYRAAIEQGVVEVALPPWHPEISELRAMLPTPAQQDARAGADGDEEEFPTEFHNWAAKGAADLIIPELEDGDGDASHPNSDDDEDTDDDDGA